MKMRSLLLLFAILCAIVPSASIAQTNLGPFLQSGTGATPRSYQNKLRDPLPTPQDFGAACDGVTDDASALQAWLNNARNGSGLPPSRGGFIPAGVCIFKSALTVPVGNDYTIEGVGQSSILKYAGSSTTIDLITIGDGLSTNSRINFRNFAVTSSTGMTAGTALKLQKLNYSLIDNVTVGDYGLPTNVYHGIWIKGGSFNSIKNITKPIAVKADAIRVNTGFELNIDNVAIVSSGVGTRGIHASGGFGGLYTGYVSLSGTELGLLVDNADAAAGNNQIFLSNRTVFDSHTQAGIYLNDTVASNKSLSMLGWCSSTGAASSGCMVVLGFANGNIQIGGGAQFLSNLASAIYYADATVNLIIDPAAALSASGRYGVECTVATSKVVSYSIQVLANTLGNYSSNCNVPVPTANRLMYGNGAAGQPGVLSSLGTTTTVLHGNAAGLPSWAPVVSADLSITATSCINQFVTAISSGGVGTCTTSVLASAQYANQGTTVTVLHGNAAGNLSFGAIVNADLATMAANTIKGNGTIGAATPTDLAMPSCSTAASALQWLSNTGFQCNTSITAAAVPVGGVTGLGTGVATALGVNVGTAGAFVVNGGALGSPLSAGTMPAFTLGGAISGGANQINNVVIGASTPLAGTFNSLTNINSQNADTISLISNTNAGAAATARMRQITDAGNADFVAFSTAGGGNYNWTWTGSGATQFIAQSATGQFIFYTGVSPAQKAILTTAGIWTVSQYLQSGAVTVAGLPTCNTGAKAGRYFVTDSNATSYTAGIGAVVAGGGTTNVPVVCDGTNWRIG